MGEQDPVGGAVEVDPTSPAGLWARFRGLPAWARVLSWIGVGLFALVLLAALGGAPEDRSVAIDDDADVAAATPTPVASPSPTPTGPATSTPSPTPGSGATTTVDGDLEVHFIHVGQADATLLLAPDATVLIDAGHWQRSDVVPYLRARGVETIDLVVITHPHADHIGQFDQVMDAFDVAEVWWSGATHTTRTFERAVEALERSDASYEEPRAGDTTTIGSLGFEVVNPSGTVDFSDLHDTSVSLRITYGDVRLLFTGDAERQTEARMVRDHRGWLDADIYQAGHHGSSTSTTRGFLDAVSPSVAIYSAGADNSYGHPHGEVIERLEAAGVETYGTDVHGTVVVMSDGASWSVSTQRDGTVQAPGPTSTPAPSEQDTDPPAASAGCGTGQVNINSAGVDDLQEIIHIGPSRAEEMVEIRPFGSVGDMRRIHGIGDGRLGDIREEGIACVP